MGFGKNFLRKKYLNNSKTIGEVKWKQGDSQIWLGLIEIKDSFLHLSTFNLHNGILKIRFYVDRWFENSTLLNICRKRHISVPSVFNSTPLNISFRRALVGENGLNRMS